MLGGGRLLDHLVRSEQHRGRDRQPERLRGFQVDEELELGGLLDREVARLGALQDLVLAGSSTAAFTSAARSAETRWSWPSRERGFCPSCGGRRRSELAAHLVERVIPNVPVRQWVLSRPWSLRYQLAFDAALCRQVLAVFIGVVFRWWRRAAAREGLPDGQCGAITVIQRAGCPFRPAAR